MRWVQWLLKYWILIFVESCLPKIVENQTWRCLGCILRPQQKKNPKKPGNKNRENLVPKIGCLNFGFKKRGLKLCCLKYSNFSILYSRKKCRTIYFKCYILMAAVQCIHRNSGWTSEWKRFLKRKFESKIFIKPSFKEKMQPCHSFVRDKSFNFDVHLQNFFYVLERQWNKIDSDFFYNITKEVFRWHIGNVNCNLRS